MKIRSQKILSTSVANTRTEQIEALSILKHSLYDVLDEQIDSHLFPTPRSRDIASFIVANLDDNGYYEGDSEAYCNLNSISLEEFERG